MWYHVDARPPCRLHLTEDRRPTTARNDTMDDYTKEQLKDRLTEYVESITERSKGANMFKCPLCGSGNGKNHTGAFNVYEGGRKWKCHACGEGGDIFDLVAAHEQMTDRAAVFTRTAELLGVADESTLRHASQNQNQDKTERKRAEATPPPAPESVPPVLRPGIPDRLEETDYPARRGLSLETCRRYGLRYVPDWRPEKNPKAPPSPRLIIPTSPTSYLARDTRPDESIPEKARVYIKQKTGGVHVFNAPALQSESEPCFIVEGEIDALSVIEAGGVAVAMGGISNQNALLEAVKTYPPARPLMIALDNDEPGKRAAGEVKELLDKAGVPCVICEPWGECKDANERLVNDRAGLQEALQAAEQAAEREWERMERERVEREQAEREAYIRQYSAGANMDALKESIQRNRASRKTPTGFPALDKELDGGLYEGLYIVGGISSLGKTTLIMQIADNIAARHEAEGGRDVLLFSLEMARAEIMAKSISRITAVEDMAQNGSTANAKTARGILDGSRYSGYNAAEKRLILESVEKYKRAASRLFIIEGMGNVGAEQVRAAVKEHTRLMGAAPVVIVDYLQILAPYNERASDKQNTDKAVLELKRIARDFSTPVIAISSLNRANYQAPVSMEAFKESGAIEYSSDVLIGLQFEGAGKDFDVNAAKAANPRKIELVILKNRQGKTGGVLPLAFYPMFNFFEGN